MTNAWIQRFLTLGSITIAWFLGIWFWDRHPVLSILCFVGPVIACMTPIAAQFIALWFVNQNDPAPRASLAAHLRAWWGEALTALKVFQWWQPFRHTSIPDGLDGASTGSGQRGVVLVHGFFCNRAFWTHWMRRLQAQQRPFIAVDLEPAFGSIDDYVSTIDRAVKTLEEATNQSPVIVGHSMGGLAIRAWLARSSAALSRKDLVHRVITLGSPHHGTWLAKFSHTTNGAQMKLDSRWIKALQSTEKVVDSVELVCFYSNCDNIVFPVSSAKLDGADNRLVHGRGHVDMAHDPVVMDACWNLMQ
jgi:triacylglycerol lipase